MQTVAAVCYPLPVYQELLVANSYDSRCEHRPNLFVQIRTKFDAPHVGHYTGERPRVKLRTKCIYLAMFAE